MTENIPPRCGHGNIILGCPDDSCEEQNAYLAKQQESIDRWLERQRADGWKIVRDALGLK